MRISQFVKLFVFSFIILTVVACKQVTDSHPTNIFSDKIVFQSNMEGSADLFLMDSDGSNLKNLSRGIGHCFNPSFSSNGNMIVFECKENGYDIYIYDIQKDTLYMVFDGGSGVRHPIFIDNDERILFSYYNLSNCLYSIKINGTDFNFFLDVPETYETFLKASSNGSIITFTGIDAPNEDIFTVNSDGSNLKRLTNSQESERKSFFTPNNNGLIYEILFLHNYEIYSMNLDGSNQQNLTKSKYNESYPDISVDENFLVYTSMRNTIWDIYLLDLKTWEEINLTNSEDVERSPKFICDDSEIVCESNDDIYLIDLESLKSINLTNNQSYNRYPVTYP